MTERPRITVAAVIEEAGRFLLVEELSEGRLKLNQPAGHLEQGETLLEAVAREVLEETAHPFRPTALLGVYHWQVPGTDTTYVRFCFRGEHGPVTDRALDGDIHRTLWLTRTEILASPQPPRSPMILACIDDYLAGRAYPLELLRHLEGVA